MYRYNIFKKKYNKYRTKKIIWEVNDSYNYKK